MYQLLTLLLLDYGGILGLSEEVSLESSRLWLFIKTTDTVNIS